MKSSMFRLTATLLLLVVVSSVSAQTIEQADAAFDQGDYAAALKAYDAVLATKPSDVHALVRSARLLSWESNYAEAIRRYDRALALDPGNREAALERAKVLSWNREFDKALKAFRQIVTDDPSNIDAQLGVARVLSWGGDQAAARREYSRILENTPSNTDALVGVAQTYAWTGQGVSAREWYDKALVADPQKKEALVGMAYLDIDSGDPYAASRITAELEQRFPGDTEIRDLRVAVARARGPVFQTAYDTLDDTDENELDVFRVEATAPLPRRSLLSFLYGRYELQDIFGREGTIDSLVAGASFRPTPSQLISLRAGVDKLEGSDGDSDNELTGGLTYIAGLGSRFEVIGSAERTSFKYSVPILDAGILIDSYSVGFNARPAAPFRISATGGLWDLSDDNERRSVDAGAWYRWPIRKLFFETGYAFRFLDYDQDRNNGYFDPKDFTSHAAQLALRGDITDKVYFSATAEGGIQSFELGVVEVDDDSFAGGTLLIGFHLTPTLALELRGAKSDYALTTGTGFESEEFGVRLRWQASRF